MPSAKHSWGPIAKLSAKDQKTRQGQKLSSFINQYLYPCSPFYRTLFNTHKINPSSIRTLQDLERIPFTTKPDFLNDDDPDRFRQFVLRPDRQSIRAHWPLRKKAELAIERFFCGEESCREKLGREFRPSFMTFTTGTTQNPIPYLYTSYDIDNLRVAGSRMIELFDIKAGDHLLNMFPYAPHLAFWQVVFGGINSSVMILSTGGGKVLGTEGNITSILRMRPAVIIGVPGYVYHVLREAREQGCCLDFVKKVVLGANAVTREYKMKVADMLRDMGAMDVKGFGTYGFTEARTAWGECPADNKSSSGYHLYPDKEIFEVIDPQTGEVQKEGQPGELVYTSIDARGSAVLRYRTGDYVQGGIIYEPCPHCGRTVPRISSVISRLTDRKDLSLSKIKGSLVNFDNFRAALSGFSAVEEWQIEIRKKNDDPHEIDWLVLYCAAREGADRDQLKAEINRVILQKTEVSANEIYFIPLKELVKRVELESANKAKRVIDLRL